MQATLNSVYDNNSMCVLTKKCLTRFTHLLWIFVRAQGWVGHLSDLYQCEYVKPYTNVNIISFFSQLQPPLFAPCRHERPCRETPSATGWRLTSGLFAGYLRSTMNPRGYPWEFLVGVCRPVLQILALFTAKKCHLQHPFSDQSSKIHTRFQTWGPFLESPDN